MIKLLIRVLTVRSVATFLRAPWCSSMVMTDLWGCEKETERCDMSLTSFPIDKIRCYCPSGFRSCRLRIPRGPSTVTILDLMCTLTIRLSVTCFPVILPRLVWAFQLSTSARAKSTQRLQLSTESSEKHTHHCRESPTFLLSVCTSSLLVVAGCHRVLFMMLSQSKFRG